MLYIRPELEVMGTGSQRLETVPRDDTLAVDAADNHLWVWVGGGLEVRDARFQAVNQILRRLDPHKAVELVFKDARRQQRSALGTSDEAHVSGASAGG